MYKVLTLLLGILLLGYPEAQAAIKGGYLVKFKPGANVVLTEGAQVIMKNPQIYYFPTKSAAITSQAEYVVPNSTIHVIRPKTGPTPDLYPKGWGKKKISADKEKKFLGQNVVVAVIDTGVLATHPALKGKVLVGEGYNFVNESADATDDHGHGTHCSGVIAGKTIGLATKAKILPIKFLDANGSGSLADAVRAIDFARNKKVNVMSNSWGGGGLEQPLADAIAAATKDGILFIAAAGNSSNDNDKEASYPANYPSVVSVAATDQDDSLAEFSNYGETTVHTGAPGVNIYSAILGNKYDKWSGTSMATPSVAGVAAMMLSKNPKLTVEQFADCITKSAVDVVGIKVVSKGRLNAVKALDCVKP